MKTYDLRSDTITKPGEGMRRAMYEAEVGDDVYGEDPSINRLQDMAAELTGKEAAIFVSSGSLGNLIPIYLLCGRGNEVIAHERAHIFHFEMASVANIAGSMPAPARAVRGILEPDNVKPLVRADIYYLPRTRMIEVENTHNLEGGSFYTLRDLAALRELADENGLVIHMDGARLFNAAVASGAQPKEICEYADTVTFCLSKGLGAPVGSVLCGESEVIAEARRVRKMLGGGMRQAGILAAAGIYALEFNIDRLSEDHVHAKMIAAALAETIWAEIDMSRVDTNILFFGTRGYRAADIAVKLREHGVFCNTAGAGSIRMVTSLAVNRQDIEEVCRIISTLVP